MPAVSSIILGTVAAVGTGVSIYGQVKANSAQAEAERSNAAFYQEQAEFAREAGDRTLKIFEDQAAEFFGKQKTSFAKAGVDISGSPLLALADTQRRAYEEGTALKEDTRMKVREAYLKAGASSDTADRLSSFTTNGLPAIGQVLTTGSQFAVGLRRNA